VSWAEYTEAARELAELRRGDTASRAERADVARTAQADVAKLTAHLAAQQSYLTTLATTLRLPAPWFGKAEPSAVTDVAQALHRAADAANAADVEARQAEQTGTRPVLLPDLSPTARNVLVYSSWAAVGWLFQCGLALVAAEDQLGTAIWSLCGLPALAFFAGYLTVSTLGQPRVGASYPKQARLGGAICFVGMPVAWIALVALRAFIGL
jgi:hypothetical protein